MDYQWLWVWFGALDDWGAQDTEGWIGGVSAFDSAVRRLLSESGRTCPLAILSKVLKNVRPPRPRLAAAQGRLFSARFQVKALFTGLEFYQGAPGLAMPKESFLASVGVTTSIFLPQQSKLPLPSFRTVTMQPQSWHLWTSAFLLMTGLLLDLWVDTAGLPLVSVTLVGGAIIRSRRCDKRGGVQFRLSYVGGVRVRGFHTVTSVGY